MKLAGYAAVFGSPSEDLGGFVEIVSPQAFDRALALGKKLDVRALVNHDPNLILGRTKSGTLRLSKDSKGLRAEIDLPDSPLGQNVAESVGRGDVDQMSFAFSILSKGGEDWKIVGPDPGQLVRTLLDVDLVDVTIATFPAYLETTVSAREQAEAGNDAARMELNRLKQKLAAA